MKKDELKRFQVDNGMKNRDIADILGCPDNYISRWYHSTKEISLVWQALINVKLSEYLKKKETVK